MKNTSKQSYKDCKESGYMTKKQQEVYNLLVACGPMTGNQINKMTHSTSNHKRLSELADKGLIMECGAKFDENTRKVVTVWGKTPEGYYHPNKPQKPIVGHSRAVPGPNTDGRVSSDMYDLGYIQGWTDAVSSMGIAVPASKIFPVRVGE